MSPRPTIRHVVFFSAKDKADIPLILEGLSHLAKIPSADVFEARRNRSCDLLSSEIDVIVYAEFASPEALDDFKDHELYKLAIDIVRPLRDMRIAADF